MIFLDLPQQLKGAKKRNILATEIIPTGTSDTSSTTASTSSQHHRCWKHQQQQQLQHQHHHNITEVRSTGNTEAASTTVPTSKQQPLQLQPYSQNWWQRRDRPSPIAGLQGSNCEYHNTLPGSNLRQPQLPNMRNQNHYMPNPREKSEDCKSYTDHSDAHQRRAPPISMDAGGKGHSEYSKSSTQSDPDQRPAPKFANYWRKRRRHHWPDPTQHKRPENFPWTKGNSILDIATKKRSAEAKWTQSNPPANSISQTPTHTSQGINAQDHQNTCTTDHQNVRTGQKIKPVSSPTLFTKPRSTRTLETKPMVRAKEESW